jgi:hypothetical protein
MLPVDCIDGFCLFLRINVDGLLSSGPGNNIFKTIQINVDIQRYNIVQNVQEVTLVFYDAVFS